MSKNQGTDRLSRFAFGKAWRFTTPWGPGPANSKSSLVAEQINNDLRSHGSVLHALVPGLASVRSMFGRVFVLTPSIAPLGTGSKRRLKISAAVLLALASFAVSFTSLKPASAAINEQLNFQARLLTSSGGLVPDGNYHVRFKIYEDGDGELGGGDETLAWTETRTGADRVRVSNGYLSVQLGSVNDTLDSAVDWGNDTIWLSIEIGGNDVSASWDGEMDPFMRLTSTPYAFTANNLDGRDSSEFVQLDPGATPQVVDTVNTAIAVNQEGSGNVLQLQQGANDVFVINNAGNATFNGNVSIQGNTVLGNSSADRVTFGGQVLGGSPLVFQGATDDSFTTTLGVEDPTASVTYLLPTYETPGVYDVCTSTGNCTGIGQTLQASYDVSNPAVIVVNSTNGGFRIRDNSTPIGAELFAVQNNDGSNSYLSVSTAGTVINNVLTANANVSVDADLDVTGTATFEDVVINSTGQLDVDGETLLNGNITLGDAAADGITFNGEILGSRPFVLEGGTDDNIVINLDVAALSTTSRTITFPDADGTVCLTSGNCIGEGSAGDVLQNGNSFGTAMTIGTNDDFTLSFETNATTRMTISNTTVTSTLPFLGPNGSSISPTYSFTNDSNTGIFTSAPGTLDFSVDGTSRAWITSTSLNSSVALRSASGTENAPAYSFSSDDDTGMYRIGANALGFVTAGTERLTIDATGLVSTTGNLTVTGGALSVGESEAADGSIIFNDDSGAFTVTLVTADATDNRTITLPDATGTVLLDTTLGNTAFLQGGNSFGATATLGTNDANDLEFITDATARLVISATGQISFDASVYDCSTNQNGGVLTVDSNGDLICDDDNDSASSVTLQGAYDNTAGATPEIVLDSTRGAVTIRDSATPLGANLFEVQDNAGTTTYLAVDATGASVDGTLDVTGAVTFDSTLDVAGDATFDGYLAVQNSTDSTTAYQFLDADGGVPVLNIDTENERVGIGTNTPGQALHVVGSIQLSGANGQGIFTAFDQLTLSADTNNDSVGDLLRFSGNGGTDYLIISDSGGVNLGSYDCSTYDNGGVLTVDSNGNVICDDDDDADSGATLTLQDAYDNTAGGTPEIVLDGTRGALTIRDNSTPLGGNLLEVQSNDGNTTYLAVDATGTAITGTLEVSDDTTLTGALEASGNITLGDAATDTLTINATLQGTNALVFEGATVDGNQITLQIQDPTANVTYRLLDAPTGTYDICTTVGNCIGGGGTGAAPATAQYLTLAADGDLTNERILTAGTNISLQDAGAGAALTVNVVDNPTFTGLVNADGGLTVDGTTTIGNAADDSLTINATLQGVNPLVFEGATDDEFESFFVITDPTVDRTITFPDASGTVLLDNSASGVFFAQGGNTFGETAQLGTSDMHTLELLTNNNTVVTISGVNGATTFQNSANSASALRVSNSGGNSILTVDTQNNQVLLGAPNVVNGTLVFGSSSTSNTTTLSSAAPSSNHAITLPNASGTVCLTSGNCAGVGGTGDILQGGNSFGTGMTIGTNDGFDLNLETDGQTRLTVDTSGNVAIGDSTGNNRLHVTSGIENSGVFEPIWQDDFDPGLDGAMWDDTNSTVVGTTCASVSGNNMMFTGGNRTAETQAVDVSNGGYITFFIYSPSSDSGGCGSPEGNEDLVLEYSTNGFSWTEIENWDPDVDPMQQVQISIPAGAQTNSTQFRWRQIDWDGNSDNWSIDNAMIVRIISGGNAAIDDDFDPSIDNSMWDDTNSVSVDTVCGGSGSVSGNALRFAGGGTRYAETIDIDASAGGYVSFYIYGPNNGGGGCEEPDSGEDMVLEYSVNSGSDWIEINQYSAEIDPIIEINEVIPVGAESNSVRFRWRQEGHSGSNFDTWTIDNVQVNVNTPLGNIGSTIFGYNNTNDLVDLLRLSSDYGGTADIKFRVQSNGDVYADGTFYGAGGVMAGAADLAEVYRNHDNAKPGHVVVFTDAETVAKSSEPYQSGMAGVVSTAPGFTLNADEDGVPVALSGRVPVKVSVENGTIQKGDYLTSGPDGRAIKATATGRVIGTALEDAAEDGTIEMFVHVGHYNPADDALFNTNVLLALQSSDASMANLNVSGQITVGELHVTGDAVIDGQLEVNEVVIKYDLTVGGKIISRGESVTPEVLSALGFSQQEIDDLPELPVEADGTDTAGTVSFTTGDNPTAGQLVEIKFNTPYAEETDPRIVIEPVGPDSAELTTYIVKTADSFIVGVTTPPNANTTYTFDYIIIGSRVVEATP